MKLKRYLKKLLFPKRFRREQEEADRFIHDIAPFLRVMKRIHLEMLLRQLALNEAQENFEECAKIKHEIEKLTKIEY